MLTQNINPLIGLANGTNKDTTLHSLSWDPDTTHCNIRLLRDGQLKPGKEYEVPFPHSVNVLSQNVEVPVLSYKARLKVPKYMRYNIEPGRRALLHQSHAVELGFAYPDFKFQGATVDKIILLLTKRPSVPHLSISSVYVGITRVKRGEDIRIWPMPITNESTRHLTKLRRSVGLHLWMKNYFNGIWNKSGLQSHQKQKMKAAIHYLVKTKADLLTKPMPKLRCIAKTLCMQHRNMPKDILLKKLRTLQSENIKSQPSKPIRKAKRKQKPLKNKSGRKRKHKKQKTRKSCKTRRTKKRHRS